MDRRHFCLLSATAVPGLMLGAENPPAGRTLVFRVEKGFGDASPSDIEAVLRSTADPLWRHCPNTTWETPGFALYQSKDFPIIDFDHRPDGWIAVGLTVRGRQWAQFAYQFAHEFCHALAGHSNDWRKPWIKGRKANHWLEESLCETSSLFALRAMAKSWTTSPPYPNWKSYAPHLGDYAQKRLDEAAAQLPPGREFADWLRVQEPFLRANATLRDKNNLVALHLLPLFEAEPSGWESLTSFNLVPREPEKTLAAHFRDWTAAAPENLRPFVGKLAAALHVGAK